jgi:C4-type Zn-finger protein
MKTLAVLVCRRSSNSPIEEGSTQASCKSCGIAIQVSKESQEQVKSVDEIVTMCNRCGIEFAEYMKTQKDRPQEMGIMLSKRTEEALNKGETGYVADWLRNYVGRS